MTSCTPSDLVSSMMDSDDTWTTQLEALSRRPMSHVFSVFDGSESLAARGVVVFVLRLLLRSIDNGAGADDEGDGDESEGDDGEGDGEGDDSNNDESDSDSDDSEQSSENSDGRDDTDGDENSEGSGEYNGEDEDED